MKACAHGKESPSRFRRLAERARKWSSHGGLSELERKQAFAVLAISNMLDQRRFPPDRDVGVLNHLVCDLCARSGEQECSLREAAQNDVEVLCHRIPAKFPTRN